MNEPMKKKWRCLIPLVGYYYIWGEGTEPGALRDEEAVGLLVWQAVPLILLGYRLLGWW